MSSMRTWSSTGICYVALTFCSREKQVEASHKTGNTRPKVDLLVKLKHAKFGNAFEFAVCESARDADKVHFNEDRLKLAKTLKNFYDALAQVVNPSHIHFIGILTMGTNNNGKYLFLFLQDHV